MMKWMLLALVKLLRTTTCLLSHLLFFLLPFFITFMSCADRCRKNKKGKIPHDRKNAEQSRKKLRRKELTTIKRSSRLDVYRCVRKIWFFFPLSCRARDRSAASPLFATFSNLFDQITNEISSPFFAFFWCVVAWCVLLCRDARATYENRWNFQMCSLCTNGWKLSDTYWMFAHDSRLEARLKCVWLQWNCSLSAATRRLLGRPTAAPSADGLRLVQLSARNFDRITRWYDVKTGSLLDVIEGAK